jgi:hypothetical protein
MVSPMGVRRQGAIVLLVAALATVAGCFGPTYVVQQYAGPARSQHDVSVLRFLGKDTVRPLDLDGEDVASPLASDARLHIEVLPGKHTLSVVDGATPLPPLELEAQAGRVYRVVVTGGTPRIYEVDRSSDILVRDVTMHGAEPRPPVVTSPPAGTSPTTPESPAAEPGSGDAGADVITL